MQMPNLDELLDRLRPGRTGESGLQSMKVVAIRAASGAVDVSKRPLPPAVQVFAAQVLSIAIDAAYRLPPYPKIEPSLAFVRSVAASGCDCQVTDEDVALNRHRSSCLVGEAQRLCGLRVEIVES